MSDHGEESMSLEALERHLTEAGNLELIKIVKRLDDRMKGSLKEALNESDKKDN